MNRKIAFIGHREVLDLKMRGKLLDEVKRQIEGGCKFFTMGTHGEFDEMALSVCRELRKTYKDIKIEVVITSFKKLEKQLLYDDEFGKEYETPYSDVSTVMYEIEEEYFKRQIVVSNRMMIDTCDKLICYVNEKRSRGGAILALNYAKKKGLEVINLYNKEDI